MVDSPKKVGYTNFKNLYLFNRKELEDSLDINRNGLIRNISLWLFSFKILCSIPLNSSICTRHQDSTPKGTKDHVTLCISSNGHHQGHEGFYGIHIHKIQIKKEGSTIYSSYQGYRGPQHHQSSGNKDFFKSIIVIII